MCMEQSIYEPPIHNHNVPCAVCAVSICETVLMIPAKTSCPTSWTREYYGYLIITMDMQDPCIHALIDIKSSFQIIMLMHCSTQHIEASCTGMPCPPYDSQKEVNYCLLKVKILAKKDKNFRASAIANSVFFNYRLGHY